MLIAIFYKFIMIIGDYVLLGGIELGYEVLDIPGVDAKFSGCISDGEFILDGRHE